MEGMEAGACSCYEDGEPSEWFRSRRIVARKAHHCCECGGTINPGEKYQRAAGKWDGRVESFKTCLVCARIRNDYCTYFTMMREQLWEMLGIDYLGQWMDRDR